jgi:cyclophilin family peptidyl-prolyl cis-trans isomerase
MKTVFAYVVVLLIIGGVIFWAEKSMNQSEMSSDAGNTVPINKQALDNIIDPGSNASIQPQAPQDVRPELLEDTVELHTNMGVVTLELYPQDAPKTVANFINLAKSGFYNGTKFHRVIKDFMIQGGDPNSKDDDWSNDGQGGPGYQFADEFNAHKLVRGTLAMANAGPNTNGSQFFIVTALSTPWLDGKHTAFGQVIKGIEVIDKIERVETNGDQKGNHPLQDMIIQKVVVSKSVPIN